MSKNVIARQSSIGETISINHGLLECSEDLIIDSDIKIDRIEVKGCTLVIGKDSTVEADIFADTIVVIGNFTGNLEADAVIDLMAGANVSGSMSAQRFLIHPDAVFQGSMSYKS